MSATRERTAARLTDAWSRAGALAPAAGALRRGLMGLRAWGRRRPRAALAALLAGLLLILGCFWLWFKDSPLVSVNRVRIVGLSGPDVPRIRQALEAAAVQMTTLDVNIARLRAAVDPYPDVRSLTVNTDFPHGMVIRVSEQVPVAQLIVNGSATAVSGTGTLLKPTSGTARLPVLSGIATSGTHVSGSSSLAVLAVLAACPYSFLNHIQTATQTSQSGVVVQLRRGPQIRFGDTTQLHDKWAAALAVLATSSAQGAQYIDVSDPGRPAAGVSTASSTPSATSAATATAGTPAGTGGTAGTTGSAGTTSGTGGTTSGTAGTAGGTAGTASTSTPASVPPATSG